MGNSFFSASTSGIASVATHESSTATSGKDSPTIAAISLPQIPAQFTTISAETVPLLVSTYRQSGDLQLVVLHSMQGEWCRSCGSQLAGRSPPLIFRYFAAHDDEGQPARNFEQSHRLMRLSAMLCRRLIRAFPRAHNHQCQVESGGRVGCNP